MGRNTLMSKQLDMFGSEVFFDQDQELKICVTCKTNLPLSCFKAVGGSRRLDGTPKLRNKCSACYNKNLAQRDQLLKTIPRPDIDYECPICLKKKGKFYADTEDSSRQHDNSNWCLDHDHDTGEFRGWLCNKCNSALGWFEDDINHVRRALNYLEKHCDK